MKDHKGVKLFSASGIIGAGKSTALKALDQDDRLAKRLGKRVIFVQEPVQLWEDKGWLDRFYENSAKTAFAFQTIAFCTYCDVVEETLRRAQGQDVIFIAERSMYDQLLFWTIQLELGRADQMSDDAYMLSWKLRQRWVPDPSGILYFETSTIQLTMARVKERARLAELGTSLSRSAINIQAEQTAHEDGEITSVGKVTLDYQERLLRKHRAWFTEPVAQPPYAAKEGIPCLHVSTDHYDVDDLVERVAEFILAH